MKHKNKKSVLIKLIVNLLIFAINETNTSSCLEQILCIAMSINIEFSQIIINVYLEDIFISICETHVEFKHRFLIVKSIKHNKK